MFMTDLEDMRTIYENLEVSSSVPDNYNPTYEDMLHESKKYRHTIEYVLRGVLVYYNRLKESSISNPMDEGVLRELENFKKHIVQHLGSFSEFK